MNPSLPDVEGRDETPRGLLSMEGDGSVRGSVGGRDTRVRPVKLEARGGAFARVGGSIGLPDGVETRSV